MSVGGLGGEGEGLRCGIWDRGGEGAPRWGA